MRKRGDHLSICQRVFSFISRLMFPGLERITLDHAVSVSDPSKPGNGEKMVNHHKPQEGSKDDDHPGSSIEINFKQTEEDLEHWTPTDKLGSSVHGDRDQPHFNKGNNFSTSLSAIAKAKGQQSHDKVKGKRSKVIEPPPWNKELPKVQVNGDSQHQGISQGKGSEQENRASEKLTVPIQPKEPKPRYRPHLLSVAPNINEKSDAFIRSRKEAMRRNLDLEQEES